MTFEYDAFQAVCTRAEYTEPPSRGDTLLRTMLE